MRQVNQVGADEAMMGTLVELTSIFQGLASMHIAQIKDQVLQSTKFYDQLWAIYSQVRVSNQFSFGRSKQDSHAINKNLQILITAESGFGGDIDQKLIRLMRQDYSPDKNDVIVIGKHGAMQLSQAKIDYKKYFKMPSRDRDINVQPLVNAIRQYKSSTIYYQSYKSLLLQEVNKIEVSSAVSQLGGASDTSADIISEETYIFEPSMLEVVAHLERSMIQITVSQLILQSKLAQYASRFQAMRLANDRADESKKNLHVEYNRAKRAVKDQRLKEIINGVKKANAVGA